MRIAIDTIEAAGHPHYFLSVTKAGYSAVVHTASGVGYHVILHSNKEPDHSGEHIRTAAQELARVGMSAKMVVGCSHASSRKDFRRRREVMQDIADQLAADENGIMDVMAESHLIEGRQDKPEVYRQDITDACTGRDTTEEVLELLAKTNKYRVQRVIPVR